MRRSLSSMASNKENKLSFLRLSDIFFPSHGIICLVTLPPSLSHSPQRPLLFDRMPCRLHTPLLTPSHLLQSPVCLFLSYYCIFFAWFAWSFFLCSLRHKYYHRDTNTTLKILIMYIKTPLTITDEKLWLWQQEPRYSFRISSSNTWVALYSSCVHEIRPRVVMYPYT